MERTERKRANEGQAEEKRWIDDHTLYKEITP